ncbi:hypothetical protein HanIR_Chr12g0587051 [Helianthus annuus]|nr:hypothetical protein HanIR_Chr12g0587051 [Helianthus annuus]
MKGMAVLKGRVVLSLGREKQVDLGWRIILPVMICLMSPVGLLCRGPTWIVLITVMNSTPRPCPLLNVYIKKNKDRSRLLEDHVRLGVNYFAMTQEIVREWSSMREQIMEFENTKREFVMDRERFNAEKKGLNWRVSDAEEKLAKEQKLNAEHQEEWTAACARTNRDLKLARDEAVKLKGEKDKASQEVMHLTASLKEKEDQADTAHKANEEALARIVDLEKAVENPKAQAKASEEVAHELGEDCKWLINHGVPLLADSLMAFEDLAK